jgi:hypothetical protein
MSDKISRVGNAAATSSNEGVARPVAGGSAASRNKHAGQKPPGAAVGMGAEQVGQNFGFTRIPDGFAGGGRKWDQTFRQVEKFCEDGCPGTRCSQINKFLSGFSVNK